MIPFRTTLPADKDHPALIPGRVLKVKIRAADGPVLLRTPNEEAEAELGETIAFDEASDQVHVYNLHDGPNAIRMTIITSGAGDVQSPSSSVAVNNQPRVKRAADGAVQGLDTLTFASIGADQVPATPGRSVVMLQAAETNGGRLWIGGTADGQGIPLDSGDAIEVHTDQAIDVYASIAGDKLHGLEVV